MTSRAINDDHPDLIAEIVLSGTPKPARMGMNRRGKIYNLRKTYMDGQKWLIKQQYRGEPFSGPVKVYYFFGFPIPKSWPKAKKLVAELIGIPHTARPDCDNLEKLYNDCIKKIIIEDDRQIWKSPSVKEYTSTPGTIIRVYNAS